MSPKKILMLGPGEPSVKTSGLGIAAHEIANFLARKLSLTIIQPDDIAALDSIDDCLSLTKQKIDLSEFSEFNLLSELAKLNIQSSISPYDTNNSKNTPIDEQPLRDQLMEFSKKIAEAAEDLDYGVIYAHDWITFRAGIDLSEKLHKPLVLHVHSLDYDRSCGNANSWIFDLEKEAFHKATKIICVSHYTLSIIRDVYQIDESKLVVVHNGCELREVPDHQSPFKEKIILFVGRLTGQKGPAKFLEIAERVNLLYPETRFIMAGEGDLYKSMIEAGAHSTVASKFHLTGYLSQEELDKLYAMADVYCMPSISEPFGLSAMEAAAARIPMVLSNRSGAAEVLNSSLISDFDDAGQFAEQITNILRNEKVALHIASENRKILESYTWEKCGQAILQIIDQTAT